MRAKGFRYQPRDIAVLTELGEVGVLDLTTIAKRHFPLDLTRRACQRRMQLFGAHELVDPIPLMGTFAEARAGRLPTLFRLSRRGAEVLGTLTGFKRRPARRNPRPETLLHRLGMAQVQLAVNDACALQRLSRPQWIQEYETNPRPDPKAPATERFILLERFPLADGRTATCWPDASCHVAIPGTTNGAVHNLLIYWEYDRSTERLAQVAGKMYGYQALLGAESYRKHWPAVVAPVVRIFFVVQSLARLQNIAQILGKFPASEAVRLATTSDLDPKGLLTEPIWRTVKGERLPILRAPLPVAS